MNLARYVQLARDRHVALAEAYHDSGRRGKAREHLRVATFYDSGGFTRQLCADLEELRDCARDTFSGVVGEPRGARRRLRALMGLYDAHDDDGDDDDGHNLDALPLHPSRDAGDDEENDRDDDDEEAASRVKAKPARRQRRSKSRTRSRPRSRSSFLRNL